MTADVAIGTARAHAMQTKRHRAGMLFLMAQLCRAQSSPPLPAAPLSSSGINAPAAPSLHNALGAPPPPPPALVAGLRSLLSGVQHCDAACQERAEDWFEQAKKWGATSVVSMKRLSLADSFLGALSLPPEGKAEVQRRLGEISIAVAPQSHEEL